MNAALLTGPRTSQSKRRALDGHGGEHGENHFVLADVQAARTHSFWFFPVVHHIGLTPDGGRANPWTGSTENQSSLTSTPFQKATRSVISLAASLGVG